MKVISIVTLLFFSLLSKAQFNDFLHFDGQDDELFAQNFPIPKNSDFTLEFFFKPSDIPSRSSNGKEKSYLHDSSMLYFSMNGTAIPNGTGLFALCSDHISGTSSSSHCQLQESCVNLRKWNHIVIQYNYSTKSFSFYTGSQYTNVKFKNAFIPGSTLHIGKDPSYLGPDMKFDIDEIRISNILRYDHASQLHPNQNKEFKVDSHTVALWHLNNNLLDETGNFSFNSVGKPNFRTKEFYADSLYNLDYYTDWTMCKGDTLVLNAGLKIASATYLWNDGSTDSIKMVTDSGLYKVQIGTLCPIEDSVSISYYSDSFSLAGDSALCSGDTLILHLPNDNNTYTWYDGDNRESKKITSSGTYWISTIFEHCKNQKQIYDSASIIFVSRDPNLGADTSLCTLDSLKLWPKIPKSAIISYLWSNGDTTSSVFIKNPLNKMHLSMEDSMGCRWRDSIAVNWKSTPSAYLPMDSTICEGDSIRIVAQVVDDKWTPMVASEYNLKWHSIEAFNILSDSSILAFPVSSGSYIVEVTADGCSGFGDSLQISPKDNPITKLRVLDTLVCIGEEVQAEALGGEYYHWFIDGSWDSLSPDSQKVFLATSSGPILVQAVINNCSGQIDSAYLSVDQDPIFVDFKLSSTSGFKTFIPKIENVSIGAEMYKWNFGNGIELEINSADDLSRLRRYDPIYSNAGSYRISLVASRSSGCVDSTFKDVIVKDSLLFHLPTAISPNQDGLNDVWRIISNDKLTISGEIYSRWGEQIHAFENSVDYSIWNAKYNGTLVQNGLYLYQLKIVDSSGNVHYLKGNLMVLR